VLGTRRSCENGCSGHGSCSVDGRCSCAPGRFGSDCGLPACHRNCSGHGTCEFSAPGAPKQAHTHARTCTTYIYICTCTQRLGTFASGDGEARCLRAANVPDACICGCVCVCLCVDAVWMQGAATPQALCRCEPGYRGVGCELRACPGSTSSDGGAQCDGGGCAECSGHGECDASTGVCSCAAPWSGAACDVHGCGATGCGPHGTCVLAASAGGAGGAGGAGARHACACEPGWSGEDCRLRTCDGGCGDAGWCFNGTCVCYPGSEADGRCSRAAGARTLTLDCSMRCMSGCATLCANAATDAVPHQPMMEATAAHRHGSSRSDGRSSAAMVPHAPAGGAAVDERVACEAECSSKCLAVCASG
jgi:hypothetical protein